MEENILNCQNHKDKDAKFICEKCKKPICDECSAEVMGKKVCRNCIDKALFSEGANRSNSHRSFLHELFFFCCSCIPGVAQLSMGLFKRGMQLMITFIGAFVLFSYVNVESFIPLIVIPLWFYSFFDSYFLRKKLDSGIQLEDSLVYDYSIVVRNKTVLGVAMLIFGFVGLLNCMDFFNGYDIFGFKFRSIIWVVKRSIFPLLLVLAGFLLISKSKKDGVEEVNIEEE